MGSALIRMRGDLRSQLQATVALARPTSVVPFVTLVTLLGVNVASAWPGERVLIVWLANVLVVTFAFMINDVEDAADDALVPAKAMRNPVSAGRLSPRIGYTAAALVGLAGMALYATLGPWPFGLGGLCLVLGILYSWRPVRLKAIPVADLISHILMLAALQLLCAYTAFQPNGTAWLLPTLLVVAVSAYGQLVNQIRDLDGDRQAGVNHTTARLGRRASQILMLGTAGVALVCFAYMLWLGVVPLWVVALFAVLSTPMGLGMSRRVSRPGPDAAPLAELDRRYAVVHLPVLIAGTIAFLAWLIAH